MFSGIKAARAQRREDAAADARYLTAQRYLTSDEFEKYKGMLIANACAGPYPANDLEISRLDKVAGIREANA